MAQPVIVVVAPVAHVESALPPDCLNPLTPERVAEETLACCRVGASVAHHHVRDTRGRIVSDMSWYRETVDAIRAESDVILNVSTGGVSDLSLEERCVGITDPRVDMASLNMGSTNFGDGAYVNTVSDIRYWATRMREARVTPELEIFGPGMLETAWRLRDEGVLSEPLHYNFCLGFENALAATPGNLWDLASRLPRGTRWGFMQAGMRDLSLVAGALGMGAGVVRVGYEDGAFLSPGMPARRNVDLVEWLVRLVETVGREVATPAQARELLQLGPARSS